MNKLKCIENYIDAEQNHYGCFLIEPLEIGQGITLGNALRRTLLSDISGLAVTGVRINNLKHEFSIIEGLREDILEVILNLKELIFKNSFFHKKRKRKYKAFLNVKGPVVITGGMLKLPKNSLTLLNLNQYICTIVDESEFYMELDIEEGRGYRLANELLKYKTQKKMSPFVPSTLLIDALFMPIKRVNYKIKLIYDTQGNIKESLNLEITTNGSITPKRSLQEALKILLKLFYPLFIDQNFMTASSDLSQNFYKQN